jgi:limonene-1,2-epoxide hydrolase
MPRHAEKNATPRRRAPLMATDTLSPLDTVIAFLRAMMAKDYDVGLAMVSDTGEYTKIPMFTVTGPAGVRAVLEAFFAPTRRNEFSVRHEAVAGWSCFLNGSTATCRRRDGVS